MQVFELSTRLNAVQRSQGDSATARAAYRACCVIECEREDRTHDYRRKGGLEASEIVLPETAPKWAKDRGKLWNAAELVERNGKRGPNARQFKKDAQTARDLMFTYPVELSEGGRLNVARIVAGYLVSMSTVAVDFNIHQPGKEGDERNYHCHMMFSTRELTAKGFGKKTREWDDLKTGPKNSKALRKFIADTLNAELAAEGKANLVKVEYLSFAARGSSQKPQRHQGPGKTHALRKQRVQLRREWEQAQRTQQRERHAKERASLKLQQDFDLQRKLAELDSRERRGREAIERDLIAARKADTPATGFRRVFEIVTGQNMREAFARQNREAERMQEAERKIADLRTGIQAERNAYVRSQTDERQRLAERHRADDLQMERAVEHRRSMDRTAEIHARRVEANVNTLQQQQSRGRSIGRDLH